MLFIILSCLCLGGAFLVVTQPFYTSTLTLLLDLDGDLKSETRNEVDRGWAKININYNKTPFGSSGFTFTASNFQTLANWKNFNTWDSKTKTCGAPAFVYSKDHAVVQPNNQIPNLANTDKVSFIQVSCRRSAYKPS